MRFYYFPLLQMIRLAMIPGIHPNKVHKKTIKNDPHPLSATATGGNKKHKMALVTLILLYIFYLISIPKKIFIKHIPIE
jgi:hypothetical protein